jgi:inosine/xanthosine triphosphatase
MKVFVASTSEHKINAASRVFTDLCRSGTVEIEGRKAPSGINEQPVGKEETVLGAMNRIAHLKDMILGVPYDYLVAFENGLVSLELNGETTWMDMAWAVVEDYDGNRKIANSAGIEIPSWAVEEARRHGFETTTASSILAKVSPASSTDPHSYLTDGAVSRTDLLEQSLRIAVAQLLRKE